MPTVALLGFLHLYVAPGEPPSPTVLELENPHVARSVLEVDGVKLGEVGPLAHVVVGGLADGIHAVGWITPTGFVRRSEAVATTPPPAR